MQLSHVKLVLGMPAVLTCVVLSAVMAYRFGWNLGTEDVDRHVYASASFAADVVKALLPLAIIGASRTQALACAVVFVIFTTYSFTASFGLAAIQNATRVGGHAAIISNYQERKAELAQLLAARREVNDRPVTDDARVAAQAAVNAVEASVKSECTDARGRNCRRLEDAAQARRTELAAIIAELAVVKRAEELDRQIAMARAAYKAVDLMEVNRVADAPATAIAQATGVQEARARTGLNAGIAAVLELGSGWGFYLLFGRHGGAPANQSPDKPAEGKLTDEQERPLERADIIERFRAERVRPVPGGRVSVGDVHAAYCTWCRDRGVEPVSLVQFGKVGITIWRRERIGGRVYYLDIALIPLAVSA